MHYRQIHGNLSTFFGGIQVRTNFSLGRSYTLGLGLRFFLFRTGDSFRQPPGAPPPSSGRGSLFRVIRVGHFCMFSVFAFFFSSSHSNVPFSGGCFRWRTFLEGDSCARRHQRRAQRAAACCQKKKKKKYSPKRPYTLIAIWPSGLVIHA